MSREIKRPMSDARLMSLDTAAIRYELSRRTIERYISGGHLRAVKIGSATRLVIEDADAFFCPPPTTSSKSEAPE